MNIVRVLGADPPEGFGWDASAAEEFVATRSEIVRASGGDVIAPSITITDRPDDEEVRILEVAANSDSFPVVSDDPQLLDMSPWCGTRS